MNNVQPVIGGSLPDDVKQSLGEGGAVVGFDNDTINAMNLPFAKEDIKADVRRQIDGWQPRYYPTDVVIRRLNDVFSHGWSFRIISHQLIPPTGVPQQVLVHGQLVVDIVKSDGGEGELFERKVVKEAFGQAVVKFAQVQGGQTMKDLASDYKAASSDALRKAATMFGIGLEIYQNDESAFQGHNRVDKHPTPGNSPPPAPKLAEPFQWQKIVEIFRDCFGIQSDLWCRELQVGLPHMLTSEMAAEILSGQHPYVHHVCKATNKAWPMQGLNASSA